MTTEQKLREALQRARRFIEYARYVLEVEHLPMRQFPSQRDADKYLKMIDEALRHQPQQKLRLALEEIREVWAGSEVGVPIYAQEAYAIRLCKQMYQIAVGALSAEPQTSDEGTPTGTPLTDAEERWGGWSGDEFQCVDSSFARQLERALQAKERELAKLHAIPEDAAISADGTVYYNITRLAHWAEEYECAMKCLDEAKVPRGEQDGEHFPNYSLWGRITEFAAPSERERRKS